MSPVISEKHREERKTKILNAAKEVFINKGFNATTIQDIITYSGVSRGGVYTYFQNTEDIFIELLRRRDIKDAWDVRSLYHNESSNWDVLHSILEQIMSGIINQDDKLVPAIYEYYFTLAWESKKHIPSLLSRFEQTIAGFSYIIQKGINEKEFSPNIQVEDFARTIITFCDGIYVSSFHLGPDNINLESQFKVFESYLRTYLFQSEEIV